MTTADKRPTVGKIVRDKAVDIGTSNDALSALNNIVNGVRECFSIHEQESTRRARLLTYENIEVKRIKAGQELLSQYFDSVFAERKELYSQLFERLDAAIERGDGETAHAALRGIVDIARDSPLASLGDLGQVRALLDDPDVVWDL